MKQPLARHENLIVQELPDEVMIYDSANDKAHCLNQTAALVWQQCDGSNAPHDIAQILSKKLGAPVKEEFVWLALDQLEKESLLHKQDNDFSLKQNGFSRREAIKRIGLASLIALPIVTSLVNPAKTLGATCVGQPCTRGQTPQQISAQCSAGTGDTSCTVCTSASTCAQ